MLISFDEFCKRKSLGHIDKQAFAKWMGAIVKTRMSENGWQEWWEVFVSLKEG